MNEHYGVARVDEDGDLVIKDMDRFMEANEPDHISTEEDENSSGIKAQTEDIDIEKLKEEQENEDEDDDEEDDDKDSFLYGDDDDTPDDDDSDDGFF